jgi:hypothetical protein
MAGDTGATRSTGSYSIRTMAILLLLAFLGGLAAMGWAMSRWAGWMGKEPAVSEAPQAALPADGPARKTQLPVLEANHAQTLTTRVSELEDRIARINVQAQAASGNAARAEGLLVAFAARRALDTGAPLGYIEGQIRLRFGQAQPRAVATIINAAREPVTLQDLQGGLEELEPKLVGRGTSKDWWADMKREVGERRLARARRLLEAGRVDAALAEVSRLPGRSAASKWMEQARRYVEARRALDLVETAAILEPRHLRSADGGNVEQESVLAP